MSLECVVNTYDYFQVAYYIVYSINEKANIKMFTFCFLRVAL